MVISMLLMSIGLSTSDSCTHSNIQHVKRAPILATNAFCSNVHLNARTTWVRRQSRDGGHPLDRWTAIALRVSCRRCTARCAAAVQVHKRLLKRGRTRAELSRGINVCRPCHSALHRLYDNDTLADQFATLKVTHRTHLTAQC